MALARDTHALLEGVDDVVVGHAKFFGKLVDAQHEGAYLIGLGIRKSFQDLAYSPKRSCTASIRRKARS